MNLQAVVDAGSAALTPASPGPGWKEFRKSNVIENFIDSFGEALPIGVVLHWNKEGGASHGLSNGYRQTTVERFAVVVVCLETELEQRLSELSTALLGAELAGYDYQVAYVSGEILEMKSETIAWREVFQVQVDRRSP